MYCSNCGKRIDDGSKFCDSCGTPTSLSQANVQAQQQLQQPVYAHVSKPVPTNADIHFRQSWRAFVTSPISLVLLIVYSIGVLLNVSDARSLLDNLAGVLEVLEFFGIEVLQQSELLYAALVVPGILIAISMWMLFVEAFNKLNSPLHCYGFQLIRTVNIVSVVLFCLGVGDIFLEIYKLLDSVNTGIREYIIETLFEELGWELFQLVLAIVVMIIMTIKTNGLVMAMRSSVSGGYASSENVSGVAVFQFVAGGWQLCILTNYGAEIDALTELPLGIFISVIMPFAFGTMLLRYKGFMNRMYSELLTFSASKRSNEAPTAVSQSSYLHTPTWKRVQEEQTDSTEQ